MIFFDTETCGLHGVPVLLQYAEDDGPIELYNIWKNKIDHTLALLEWMCYKEICGFNLTFDWFHINKIYNIFNLAAKEGYRDYYAEDIILKLAQLERDARDGFCLKPKAACDIMLHARKGPYQTCMDRKDVKIKRVPAAIAEDLAEELEQRVFLKDIYFGRRADKQTKKWQVEPIEDQPEFRNVVLRFAPTSALKALATDALEIEEVDLFSDVELSRKLWPIEYGYAPFTVGKGAWPDVLSYHISHWEYDSKAREYAEKDVEYTRRLYNHFGRPEPGDDDSELACMIAAIRWKGFKVDLNGVRELREKALLNSSKAPTAPNYVLKYLKPHLDETEQAIVTDTKKVTLEELIKWKDEEGNPHPVVAPAQEVLDARMAQKEVELYDKLILAGRFHASFKIIGALSGRMSGADGLNPQGIKRTREVRQCFPLAPNGMCLCGGDFASFEVCIAAAYYDDPKLNAELQKGKKIHALFGTELYPEETYESILASKEKYTKAKSALFAMGLYGGTGHTVKERLGLNEEVADKAKENWAKTYPGIGKRQKEIHDKFCSMRQPGGIGTQVEWHEPVDYIESMLGFRRYFTLENMICKALFDLGEKPPKKWQAYKIKVQRRDREQTVSGAARSACFAAAFAIQGANLRAANNHVIQSTGAEITKHVQRKVCDLQPCGVHEWIVMPMNVHDELMVPTKPEMVSQLETTVKEAVEEYREQIPLIKLDWENNISTWADK